MFDRSIKSIMALEREHFLTAPPHTTVSDAARLMATRNAGAVLVVQDDRLVGIFTERDVVFRVIAKDRDPAATPLEAVMTPSPRTLEPNRTYGHALLLMQENGFRRVPVVQEGRLLGIVSSRNAMDPELEEFVSEQRRREHHR
ncbi:MAG TPA: CBS domain-containing protein [Burkholderiaceae bacterium]|nr:CBS domain-containing protein [Burkholderiaceae bacterium]